MEDLSPFFKVINEMTPLGTIFFALIIILQLIRGKNNMKSIEKVATNHISVLPEMHETLKRIEEKMDRINEDTTILIERTNGGRKRK